MIIYNHLWENIDKGKISYDDAKTILQKYKSCYSSLIHGNDVSIIVWQGNGKTMFNTDNYMKYIHKVKIHRWKDNQGKKFENFKYWFFRTFKFTPKQKKHTEKFLDSLKEDFQTFDFEEKILEEERRNYSKKYINYVGLRNYLSSELAKFALDDIYCANNERIIQIEILMQMNNTINRIIQLNNLMQMEEFNENHSGEYGRKYDRDCIKIRLEFEKYSYQAPMLHANNLLAMTHYILNYTREVNEQNDRRYFNYYNIGNLEEISAKLVDNNGNEEEVPIQINPVPKLQKELENVKTDLSNLRKRMKSKRRKLRKMENPEDRTPNKEETIRSLQEELSNDEKNAEEYVSRRDRLECGMEECQENDYKDSLDFFRHIRNSLAHGNYIITYCDLNNLEEIRYCFKDIDERNLKTYTVELTAKQLLMILDAVQLKVNECNRGYLDGKAIERKIMEVALRQCEVGMDEINDEQLREEETIEEKGDEEIDES